MFVDYKKVTVEQSKFCGYWSVC